MLLLSLCLSAYSLLKSHKGEGELFLNQVRIELWTHFLNGQVFLGKGFDVVCFRILFF